MATVARGRVSPGCRDWSLVDILLLCHDNSKVANSDGVAERAIRVQWKLLDKNRGKDLPEYVL